MPTFSGSMLRTFPNFTFLVCRARNATAISELTPQLPGRHVEVESSLVREDFFSPLFVLRVLVRNKKKKDSKDGWR